MLREFSVQLEDKVGAMNRLARTLAEREVKILSMAAKVTPENPTVGLVAEEDARLREALEASHFTFEEGEMASATVSDDPQDFAKLTEHLANAMIDIKSVYILAKVGTTVQYGFVADNAQKIDHVLSEPSAQELIIA